MLTNLIALLLASVIVSSTSTILEVCEKRQGCKVPVRIDSGVVCGRVRRAEDGTKYASYRGIPYGKPPTGHRRFKELEAVEPWGDQKPYYATEDAPACPQTDFIYGRIPLQPRGQSEDCIYLNLHVPCSHLPKKSENCEKEKPLLPVLVFIHGGSFQSGSGLTDFQGPEYLMTRPVLVITFNYRLNIFGFLCLNTKEIPGNQGFRDMLTLLKWVKRNVRAFGGDPDNVTLMGQSAGAVSAQSLSLSNASKGLFHRLVLMSGSVYGIFTPSLAYAKHIANLFLQEVGINSTDPTVIHEQLIRMPLLRIMDANTALQYSNQTGISTFTPVAESKFSGVTRILDDDPLTLIAKGRGKQYPTIISFTTDELNFAKWLLTRKNFLSTLQQDPSVLVNPRLVYSLKQDEVSEISAKILEKYFNDPPITLGQLMNYFSKQILIYPAFKLAQWLGALRGAPVYMYQYGYEADFSVIKAGVWVNYMGAAHLEDLASVFRVNSILGERKCPTTYSNDYNMTVWMVRLITDFMTCGSPLCGESKGSWPPVSKNNIRYLNIRQPFQVTITRPTSEQRDMVEFFDSLDPDVRNLTRYLGAEGSL